MDSSPKEAQLFYRSVHLGVVEVYWYGSLIDGDSLSALVSIKSYLGRSLTGAFFNPLLASTIQYGCSGISAQDHALVYWGGPVAGYFVFTVLTRLIEGMPRTTAPGTSVTRTTEKKRKGKKAKKE